jgi:hypothetical protein
MWLGGLAALALALAAAGCGDARPTLAPVRGHVYYHGAPLAGGAIVFTPDPEHGGRGPLACARIGDDGGYILSTGSVLGAVAGWHRVSFKTFAAAPDPAGAAGAVDARLPSRFSDPEKSGQVREVKAGQANVIDFQLE